MKKVLLVMLLAVSSMFFNTNIAKAGASIDQQYTAGTGSVSIYASLGRFAQTFKPTYSILDKVELELANVTGSHTMSVSIRHRDNLIWDEGYMTTVENQTISNGWNTFDFADLTLKVTDTDTYGIWINCPDNGPQWKYTGGPSTYSRGFAIWQSNDKFDWDYNFKTWGLEPTEIVDENTQPTDDTSVVTDGQTAGSGEAPSVATSDTLKAPTDLATEYRTDVGSVKLTWTKSTTNDIDGYKIYRSENKTTGFKEIGKTGKTTYEYLDGTALTVGTTYYYFVRSYKSTSQSVSSSTVNITIPAAAVSTVAETTKKANPILNMVLYNKGNYDDNLFYALMMGSAAILILLLVWYEIRRAKKGKFISGNHFKIEK